MLMMPARSRYGPACIEQGCMRERVIQLCLSTRVVIRPSLGEALLFIPAAYAGGLSARPAALTTTGWCCAALRPSTSTIAWQRLYSTV